MFWEGGGYHFEDSVGVVREGLVLLLGVSGGDKWGWGGLGRTMTHTPDRSFSVFSGGAAMMI